MKQVFSIINNNKILQRLIPAGVIAFLFLPMRVVAQDSTAAPAAEESSVISPSIEFLTIQKGDNSVDLKATLKTKVKGTFYKLPYLKVHFILVTDSAEKELGTVITDENGKALLNAKPEQLILNAAGQLHVKASVEAKKGMDATEEEITVKRARLIITPVKEDSVTTIKATLVDMSTGTDTPVKETAVGIFVKRSFNPLKLGEGSTDEAGEVSVEIPAGLPGDVKGNLTLLAKVDENETYGNLESAVVQQWGKPVSEKIEDQPRALWSSHPPMWMLITFIVLMLAVWGHYIVIVYELIRLRKEQPHATV